MYVSLIQKICLDPKRSCHGPCTLSQSPLRCHQIAPNVRRRRKSARSHQEVGALAMQYQLHGKADVGTMVYFCRRTFSAAIVRVLDPSSRCQT